jgi:hypothetical protein
MRPHAVLRRFTIPSAQVTQEHQRTWASSSPRSSRPLCSTTGARASRNMSSSSDGPAAAYTSARRARCRGVPDASDGTPLLSPALLPPRPISSPASTSRTTWQEPCPSVRAAGPSTKRGVKDGRSGLPHSSNRTSACATETESSYYTNMPALQGGQGSAK